MVNHSSYRRRIYYHGCGRIKYDIWVKYSALPTFIDDGRLYASLNRSTAIEYAEMDGCLWDQVVTIIQSRLKLPEITDMEPIDLGMQIRSIIEKIRREKVVANIGSASKTLASYFPISSKEFRKAILEAQEEVSRRSNYVFAFLLEGETVLPNTLPHEPVDYGYSIPLTGPERTRSAVVISVNEFVRIGNLYIKRKKDIPALNLEDKLLEVGTL